MDNVSFKGKEEKSTIKNAFFKTWNNFISSFPVILGVLLLISLIFTLIQPTLLSKIFTGNRLLDPLIGAIAGSLSAGNASTSYIIGGELQQEGVSLLAVTAFIVSWVTVGIVQLPAEVLILNKRFAVIRNSIAFVSSIIVAILTVVLLY
jgi:uncharacterized membrane protein YraQ (UPF0718 family)